VLAQSPPANASQVAAPKISLLVTGAADPAAYVMPSFVGQPLGTAARVLQDSGFKLGNVTVTAVAGAGAAGNSGGAAGGNSGAGANGSAAGNSNDAATAAVQPASPTAGQTSPYAYPGLSATPVQPSPASIIVSQTPTAGQKVVAGATVNFEVR
jgi:hypothetical protein